MPQWKGVRILLLNYAVYFAFKITAGKSLEKSGHQLGQGKEIKFSRIEFRKIRPPIRSRERIKIQQDHWWTVTTEFSPTFNISFVYSKASCKSNMICLYFNMILDLSVALIWSVIIKGINTSCSNFLPFPSGFSEPLDNHKQPL